MTTHTWPVVLSSGQCQRRLAEATLGPLAVIVDGRPEIYPINHVYDHETSTVAFPTNTGTKLHDALHWPWVAFEVDGLEDNHTSGWSVLVTGHAEEITAADDIARLAHQRTALCSTRQSENPC